MPIFFAFPNFLATQNNNGCNMCNCLELVDIHPPHGFFSTKLMNMQPQRNNPSVVTNGNPMAQPATAQAYHRLSLRCGWVRNPGAIWLHGKVAGCLASPIWSHLPPTTKNGPQWYRRGEGIQNGLVHYISWFPRIQWQLSLGMPWKWCWISIIPILIRS